jgi:hypothetical protein
VADVIKKVGATNSPTVMDYSSIQAWNDAAPSDLTAANQRWIGECYNQGILTTATANIGSGNTVDSTRYFWLRTASGASFRDNAGVRTNPLFLDTTKGITIQNNDNYNPTLRLYAQYTTISYLQVQNLGGSATIRCDGTSTTIDSCILSGGNSALTGAHYMYNTLAIIRSSGGNIMAYFGTGSSFYNCTLVNASGTGGTAFPFLNYGQGFLQNCCVFGFGTMFSGAATSLVSGSDYNATDLATSFGAGTHNLNSLTYASQFVNSASDYRAVSTGGLHAGLADSTHAPVDISGTTRSATTPYIGAWEVASASTTAAQLSQLPLELAVSSSAPLKAQLSQLPLEILVKPTGVQLSQLPLEIAILSSTPLSAQLSQLPLEILVKPTTTQLSQLPLEILVLPTVTPTFAQLSQLPLEILVGPIVIPPTERVQFYIIV